MRIRAQGRPHHNGSAVVISKHTVFPVVMYQTQMMLILMQMMMLVLATTQSGPCEDIVVIAKKHRHAKTCLY